VLFRSRTFRISPSALGFCSILGMHEEPLRHAGPFCSSASRSGLTMTTFFVFRSKSKRSHCARFYIRKAAALKAAALHLNLRLRVKSARLNFASAATLSFRG